MVVTEVRRVALVLLGMALLFPVVLSHWCRWLYWCCCARRRRLR